MIHTPMKRMPLWAPLHVTVFQVSIKCKVGYCDIPFSPQSPLVLWRRLTDMVHLAERAHPNCVSHN